jgi:hypothetical protein
MPPVDLQVPGQERSGDHAGPVVHEALGAELAHTGVHDGDAGAALLPGRQGGLVVVPPGRAGTVVPPGHVREHGRDLVEEVAPGELPAELLATRLVLGRPGQRQRGDGAETQVGTEPGGAVAGQIVVLLPVLRQPVAEPVFSLLAGGAFTPGGQIRGRCGAVLYDPAYPERRRDDDRGGSGDDLPPGGGGPGAPVRGEDLVVIAADRVQGAGRDDRGARGQDQLAALAGAGALQGAAAVDGVVRHVVGHEHAFGAGLGGQLHDLGDRVAVADDQVATAVAQRLAQVGERAVQEVGPVGRDRGQRRIGDEQRDHLAGLVAGGGERRVVVYAQVAGEHHDRGFHRHSPVAGPPRGGPP